jgi:SAM-dependent methyltransferase
MKQNSRDSEDNNRDQLRAQYELEKELAARLLSSKRPERLRLYKEVYDELFAKVAAHPQVLRMSDPEIAATKVSRELAVLRRFIREDTTFLEIGAGDCQLSLNVAQIAKQVYAVEVTDALIKEVRWPQNFTLMISNALSLDLPSNSIDFAYSYQVMEHLHPEDAREQLCEVHRVLASGGCYLCVTPNKLGGPWDVSRYFDPVATGLHLKEYTNAELEELFLDIGFSRVRCYLRAKGLHLLLPTLPIKILEGCLARLPADRRSIASSWYPFLRILGASVLGTK